MKYKIRQSLIDSLRRSKWTGDDSGFLMQINGGTIPDNEAMSAGREFEALIMYAMDHIKPPGNFPRGAEDLWKCACEFAEITRGGTFQAHLRREIVVDGEVYVVDGTLDCLKAGIIYDYKFSPAYVSGRATPNGYKKPVLNAYLDSPQTPAYFFLVPKATKMIYLISDGHLNCTETYHPDEVEPMESVIRDFIRYLTMTNLIDAYHEHWRE